MNIIHIISDTFRRDNLAIYGGKGIHTIPERFRGKMCPFLTKRMSVVFRLFQSEVSS